VIYSKPLLSFK